MAGAPTGRARIALVLLHAKGDERQATTRIAPNTGRAGSSMPQPIAFERQCD